MKSLSSFIILIEHWLKDVDCVEAQKVEHTLYGMYQGVKTAVQNYIKSENFRCESMHKEFGLTCVKDEGHDGTHEFPLSWYA